MDVSIFTWMMLGAAPAFLFGFGVHAVYMRWWLSRHLPEHPEYKMYIDLLNGRVEEKVNNDKDGLTKNE